MMAREQVNGVLVLSSPLYNAQGEILAGLQMKHRLPAIFANRATVEAGGLMSYGADLDDLYRRAAAYMTKFLRGKSLLICQLSKHPNTEWSSTLSLQKHWASPSPPPFRPALTR